MSTKLPGPYDGWTLDQVKQRCRELVRAIVNKDMLICSLLTFGNVEEVPEPFRQEILDIIDGYCDPDEVYEASDEEITHRLRMAAIGKTWGSWFEDHSRIYHDAANEIERLRKMIRTMENNATTGLNTSTPNTTD